MSQKSSSQINEPPLREIPDDPLAELARLVSAGSVFAPMPPAAQPAQNPAQPAPPANLSEPKVSPRHDTLAPAPEAISVYKAGIDEFDYALGAQLEAELVNELQVAPDEPQAAPMADLAPSPRLEAASSFVAPKAAAPVLAPKVEAPKVEAPKVAGPVVAAPPVVAVRELTPAPVAEAASFGKAETGKPSEDAIEEALNLDSFFDEEFGRLAAPVRTNVAASEISPDRKSDTAYLDDHGLNFADLEAEIAAATRASAASTEPIPGAAQPLSAQNGDQVEYFDQAPRAASQPQPAAASGGYAYQDESGTDPLDMIDLSDSADEFAPSPEPRVRSGFGRLGVAVAAILLLGSIGGIVGYYFLGSGSRDGDAPVILAEDVPVRVKPDNPGGKEIPNQDRTVYETIAGTDRGPAGGELVDRSETAILSENQDDVPPRVVLPGASASPESGEVSSTRPPSGPRTVRTVIVRPDGSVVEPEAGTTQKPTEQAAPLPPRSIVANTAAPVAPIAPVDPVTPEVSLTPRSVNTETVSAEPASAADAASPAESSAATAELKPVDLASLAPLPRANTLRGQRVSPSDAARPAAVPAAVRPPAIAPPTPLRPGATSASVPPAGAVPAPAASASGGFVVQLSSQRSAEDAQKSFRDFQRRYAFLEGYTPNIQRADLGDRGIFHRLRVGPFERTSAIQLCEKLKASGGDCIVRPN